MGPVQNVLPKLWPHGARLAEAFGRLLYPPHCVVCGRPTAEDEDRYLCRSCIGQIQFVGEPVCKKCGHELGPYVPTNRRCINCRNTPLRFNKAVAAAHHAGSARDMVLALKFARQKHNVYPLSKLLTARLEGTALPEQAQLILPVPLHRKRQRSRGFNQSALLAREVGERLGLPVLTDGLRRVVNTPPQTGEMSLASRRANVKGAFRVKAPRKFTGKSVLLVDDVLTTGATTSECAGTLKRAGAKKVFVATVTRRMVTPQRPESEQAAMRYEIRSALPSPENKEETSAT